MCKRVFVLFIGMLAFTMGFGQKSGDTLVKGYLLEDSTKIGMPVHYVLTLKYPEGLNILFPDSLYSYSPFEFIQKSYFPTITENNFSYDSAVYELSTFEIDSVQFLQIPVLQINENDTSLFYPNKDSVVLQFVVKELPDSINVVLLKENTLYNKISRAFNYPYLIAGIILLTLVLIIGWVIFGKRIIQYFKLKKLIKSHSQFIDRFDTLQNEIINNDSKSAIENGLKHWKDYLEKIENKPFRKLTTKELTEQLENEELLQALQEIDRAIYSSSSKDSDGTLFSHLKNYAESKYKEKYEKIKHGSN